MSLTEDSGFADEVTCNIIGKRTDDRVGTDIGFTACDRGNLPHQLVVTLRVLTFEIGDSDADSLRQPNVRTLGHRQFQLIHARRQDVESAGKGTYATRIG